MVNRKKRDISYLLFFIAGVLVLNIVSYYYFTRFDFTAEKRYTLNPLTRDVLQNINDPMQITVYLEGDFPAGFKHLRNETRDLLTGYRSYAGGAINVDFVNPSEGNPQQQQETDQRPDAEQVPCLEHAGRPRSDGTAVRHGLAETVFRCRAEFSEQLFRRAVICHGAGGWPGAWTSMKLTLLRFSPLPSF